MIPPNQGASTPDAPFYRFMHWRGSALPSPEGKVGRPERSEGSCGSEGEYGR